MGAVLSFRSISSPGQAVQLSWNRNSDWGQTQWRADLARAAGARTLRLGVDHSWPLVGPPCSAPPWPWSGFGGNANPTSGLIWGVLGTASPWPQWSLDASLRGLRRSDGAESVNANIGLSWQAIRRLVALLALHRVARPGAAAGAGRLGADGRDAADRGQHPTYRSLQLLLRYQDHAGSPSAPLGGLPGTGAGSLAGTVFFDADANGRREASEGGVPGITVILDRRYVTQTDAQGRYEFPSVAAGEHLIEVSPDNVPLPWSPTLRDPVKTTVGYAKTNRVDFPVQRER